MKQILMLTACALTFATQAQSKHPEHDAVLTAVDKLIVAINTSDLELMRAAVLADSMNYIVKIGKDGQWEHRSVPQSYFLDPANQGPEKLTERYWSPTVMIEDNIAIFWAPYDFYVDGKFSHCGTDAFNLIKVKGEWKVGNASWTAKKEGCTPHPEGPPAGARP